MRQQLLKLVVIVAAIAGCIPFLAAQASRPQAAAPAALSGVVTDGATNQPIPAAFVEVSRTDAGKTTTRRVRTDGKGRFVFTDLEPGSGYSVTGGAMGYVTSDFGWQPGASDWPNDRLTFRLENGSWKRDVAVRIWRRGTIGGRVTDEHGQPVVGVAVRAYAIATVTGLARLVATGAIASTDDRGAYRLFDLEPGVYKVGVLSVQSTVPAGVPQVPQALAIGVLGSGGFAPGSFVASPVVDGRGSHRLAITNFATPPPPVDGRSRAYPAIFYPAASSPAESVSIAVTWGTDRGGVDIRLQPAPAFVVSGRLEGSLGAPLFLRLLPVGLEHLGVGSEAATTTTENDGAFTFLNVPSGTYTLIGQGPILELVKSPASNARLPDPPGYPASTTTVGSWAGTPGVDLTNRAGAPMSSFVRQPLAVSDDVSAVVIPASQTSSIRGRVIYADGSLPPVANSRLSISVEPSDGDPSLGNPSGYVDSAGAFSVDGVLPGRYRLHAGGRVISSVIWRGREIADAGMEITTGQAVDDVSITVTGKPAAIRATVTGLAADSRAAVIVFPAARDQWTNYGWNPPRISSATTNASGVADFARLPAGDYLVVAVESSKTYAWTDPKFFAAASALASRVSVGWGESKPLTLKVEQVVVR